MLHHACTCKGAIIGPNERGWRKTHESATSARLGRLVVGQSTVTAGAILYLAQKKSAGSATQKDLAETAVYSTAKVSLIRGRGSGEDCCGETRRFLRGAPTGAELPGCG